MNKFWTEFYPEGVAKELPLSISRSMTTSMKP